MTIANVPRRVVNLAGAVNCRDMGGYPTQDGRRVRWGQLYRSGTLHAMTADDLAHMRGTGIRAVCDLRSNSERQHQPNQLSGIPDIDYWFRDHDQLPGDLVRMLKEANASTENAVALMHTIYRDLPYEFAAAYRELFGKLIQGDTPLLFNCTAGKDRTGVAAALVLSALGVAPAAVMEDYLLTEQFYEQNCDLMLRDRRPTLFANLDRRIWEPLLHAEASYLDSMFDQLHAQHGSVDKYLSDELGVDEAKLRRLRANLLETV